MMRVRGGLSSHLNCMIILNLFYGCKIQRVEVTMKTHAFPKEKRVLGNHTQTQHFGQRTGKGMKRPFKKGAFDPICTIPPDSGTERRRANGIVKNGYTWAPLVE